MSGTLNWIEFAMVSFLLSFFLFKYALFKKRCLESDGSFCGGEFFVFTFTEKELMNNKLVLSNWIHEGEQIYIYRYS